MNSLWRVISSRPRRSLVFFGVALLLSGLPARAVDSGELARTIAELDRARILRLADDALKLTPPAITDHRATNSNGGPHDYYSNGDYYWPNPGTTSGLPYAGRDGHTNPNNFDDHRIALRSMKDAVAALAAAYAVTGDDKYVSKSAELLRVFFLDEKTRMNPNLEYAQAILGKAPGNPIGVIDGLHLAELPFAVRCLEKSPAFDPAVDKGVHQWFADYARWITTSTNGVREMNALNNHSIACFVQLASYAHFNSDEKLLDLCRTRFKEVLLPNQMATNGSFTLELLRTKPYGYSIFQADNVAILCHLLSTPEEDFWKLQLADGRTPALSIQFIYPYLADKNKWIADGRPKDVMHWENWPVRQVCLLFAYSEFNEPKYFELWKKLEPDPSDLEIRRNLAVTQPLLWVVNPAETPIAKK